MNTEVKTALRVSVIVPTYRRPADLARCLAALDQQLRPADEVIVVARPDDHPTQTLLREFPAGRGPQGLQIAPVTQPGVVAAYNRGLDTATGDIICFTDDDAAPRHDWTQRVIEAFLSDPGIGGVGGRDIVHEHGRIIEGASRNVGLVRWYGRPIGNHHIGYGAARRVHVLKGVNMAFRHKAVEGLRFDQRLRGNGAQVHCEMEYSLEVLRRKWALVYDPSILVEHYPAPRGDEDQRFSFNHVAFYNTSFNLRLIMREHLSRPGRWAFVVYSTLIGNRADPGLARAITLAFSGVAPGIALRKWWIGLCALRGAWQETRR